MECLNHFLQLFSEGGELFKSELQTYYGRVYPANKCPMCWRIIWLKSLNYPVITLIVYLFWGSGRMMFYWRYAKGWSFAFDDVLDRIEFEAGSGVPNLMACSCQSGVRVAGIGEDLPSDCEKYFYKELWCIWFGTGHAQRKKPRKFRREFRGVLLSRIFLLSYLTATPRTKQNTVLSSCLEF